MWEGAHDAALLSDPVPVADLCTASSRVLERAGITAVVHKAPLSVSKTGCTYCVKLKETQLERALLLLDRAAIQRGKIYRLLEDGTYQEVTV